MDSSFLIHKLIEIEQALATAHPNAVRKMVMDVEDYILQTQKDSARFVPARVPMAALRRAS